MNTKTTLYIDFVKESTPVVIFAKQNDNSRALEIFLLMNGLPIETQGVSSASIRITSASGGQTEAVGTISGTRNPYLSVTIPPAALTSPGMAAAEVVLYAASSIISSQLFYINVQGAATYSLGG